MAPGCSGSPEWLKFQRGYLPEQPLLTDLSEQAGLKYNTTMQSGSDDYPNTFELHITGNTQSHTEKTIKIEKRILLTTIQ